MAMVANAARVRSTELALALFMVRRIADEKEQESAELKSALRPGYRFIYQEALEATQRGVISKEEKEAHGFNRVTFSGKLTLEGFGDAPYAHLTFDVQGPKVKLAGSIKIAYGVLVMVEPTIYQS